MDLPQARPFVGGARIPLKDYERRHLVTDSPRSEEAFATLEYYARVKDAAANLFAKHHPEQDKALFEPAFPIFRAAILQAKVFYTAAQDLHHRASPLLFYYSFMNLAKALIALRDPVSAVAKTHFRYHGLQHTATEDAFNQQTITVMGGVFQKLYQELFNRSIATRTSINVMEMFEYIPDVASELGTLGLPRTHRTIVGQTAVVADQKDRAWPLFAIANLDRLRGTPYEKKVFAVLEEVDLGRVAYDLFDIKLTERKHVRFYQTRMTYPNNSKAAVQDVVTAFSDIFESVLFSTSYDFYAFEPFGPNREWPMTPLVAAHCVFFYLGSLVRYQPDYLESLLHEKEAWLIERFGRSVAAATLIRYVNTILKESLLIETI